MRLGQPQSNHWLTGYYRTNLRDLPRLKSMLTTIYSHGTENPLGPPTRTLVESVADKIQFILENHDLNEETAEAAIAGVHQILRKSNASRLLQPSNEAPIPLSSIVDAALQLCIDFLDSTAARQGFVLTAPKVLAKYASIVTLNTPVRNR